MKPDIKPYHKFNSGMGATLCNNCGKMICEGMTNELYCKVCLPKKIQKKASKKI